MAREEEQLRVRQVMEADCDCEKLLGPEVHDVRGEISRIEKRRKCVRSERTSWKKRRAKHSQAQEQKERQALCVEPPPLSEKCCSMGSLAEVLPRPRAKRRNMSRRESTEELRFPFLDFSGCISISSGLVFVLRVVVSTLGRRGVLLFFLKASRFGFLALWSFSLVALCSLGSFAVAVQLT